jgi:hypothetical protein
LRDPVCQLLHLTGNFFGGKYHTLFVLIHTPTCCRWQNAQLSRIYN